MLKPHDFPFWHKTESKKTRRTCLIKAGCVWLQSVVVQKARLGLPGGLSRVSPCLRPASPAGGGCSRPPHLQPLPATSKEGQIRATCEPGDEMMLSLKCLKKKMYFPQTRGSVKTSLETVADLSQLEKSFQVQVERERSRRLRRRIQSERSRRLIRKLLPLIFDFLIWLGSFCHDIQKRPIDITAYIYNLNTSNQVKTFLKVVRPTKKGNRVYKKNPTQVMFKTGKPASVAGPLSELPKTCWRTFKKTSMFLSSFQRRNLPRRSCSRDKKKSGAGGEETVHSCFLDDSVRKTESC